MHHETSKEIELDIVHFFGMRKNLIIPNLSYGLLRHECDLAILSSFDYLYEVEIKISKQDLLRDKKKAKWAYYDGYKIRKLWFAIPTKLLNCIEHVPDIAGILLVNSFGRVSEIRKPRTDLRVKQLTEREKYKFARLGALRIWNLKKKILKAHIA